ncbi:MAG: hypothetical protein QF489_03420 [Planctomycetota bacterium]|jgi:hypothetical protein|nr:hypothetical protein [Planctomycetota bacterium]
MELLFQVLVAVVIGVVAYFVWQAEKRRREEFGIWAAHNGWSYSHHRDKTIHRRFGFLDRLQKGHSRIGYNLLEGDWQGFPAAAFTFRYKTGSGKNQSTHHFSVALINIERPFPELRVHPENILSRFGQALGFDDIDFESMEFSKAFTVRSRDRKLAFDFCHTGMMEYLLRHRNTAIELEGSTLALFRTRKLSAADLEPMLNHLTGIRGLMPEYLFRD